MRFLPEAHPSETARKRLHASSGDRTAHRAPRCPTKQPKSGPGPQSKTTPDIPITVVGNAI